MICDVTQLFRKTHTLTSTCSLIKCTQFIPQGSQGVQTLHYISL